MGKCGKYISTQTISETQIHIMCFKHFNRFRTFIYVHSAGTYIRFSTLWRFSVREHSYTVWVCINIRLGIEHLIRFFLFWYVFCMKLWMRGIYVYIHREVQRVEIFYRWFNFTGKFFSVKMWKHRQRWVKYFLHCTMEESRGSEQNCIRNE